MNDSTSLDRLHDIVVPAPVPWWPVAPGWYFVIVLALFAISWWLLRQWQAWQANAYRRAALRQLQSAHSTAEISELLRRTALCRAPRSTIARLYGRPWTDWLAEHSPRPMSDAVREQLNVGVYGRTSGPIEGDRLQAFAADWIRYHRLPQHQRPGVMHDRAEG